MRPPLRIALALALAAAAVYALAAFSRDFWAPDEPDFADAVREMNLRGSWLLPYQNGKPYSEKPILYYWALAATTPLTGGDVDPGALRIPSIVSGAFLVFGASLLAGWRGGRREALLAGAATAVAPLVFWQAQFIQIDALFTALLFAAFVAQMLADVDAGRRERWVWAFQVLMPLAVLTKGPLAIVLTGLVAIARCALTRSVRPVLDLRPVRGVIVFAAIVVPWYWLATRAGGPEYAYGLIVKQNWTRFFDAFDHVKPWWFYLQKIWDDFAPWTFPALVAPFTLRSAGTFRRRPELSWALTVILSALVLLSASESKQGKYFLVAYPFAAVLLAAAATEWERSAGRGLRFFRGYLVLLSGILLGGALALWPVAARKAPGYSGLAPFVAAPLVVGALGTFWVLWKRRGEAVPAALALAATLAATEAVGGPIVFRAMDVAKTGRPFYDRIRPLVGDPGVPLLYWGDPYRSYPMLQLRRHTAHAVTEDALVDWLAANPDGYVLVNEIELKKWADPGLVRLRVVDSQPIGHGRIFLLRRP
ncbi:MAG: glycosyltransferase family 39 protein [Thermoanaerobaculia bacterium]